MPTTTADHWHNLVIFTNVVYLSLFSISSLTHAYKFSEENLSKTDVFVQVTFEVSIQVNSCPEDPAQWQKKFDIYPVGLTEKLTVHIDLNCECDCEQSEFEVSVAANFGHHSGYNMGQIYTRSVKVGQFKQPCENSRPG